MRIAVTGSRTLSTPQRRQVKLIFRGLLSVYGPEDEFHHGAANGVDTIAATIARQFGLHVVAHHPKEKKWVGGYRERNKEIVDACDYLIAVHSPLSSTGGTIWTYNYAESLGKRAEWIELS